MAENAIPQNVIKALARVRESGAYNMFDRNGVINQIALDDNADWEAAEWLTDNKGRYMDALNAMGAWISRPDFDPSELDEDETDYDADYDRMVNERERVHLEALDADDPTMQPPQPTDTRARSRFYVVEGWRNATVDDLPPANEGAVEALGEFIYDRLVDGIIPAVEALGENLYGTVLAGSSEQQDTLDALPKPTEGKCVICMGKGMIPNFAGGHDLCGHCNGSGNEPMVTQAGDEILDNMPLWMKEWASHHPFEDIPKELYEAHEEHARELDRLERENTQLRDEVERLRAALKEVDRMCEHAHLRFRPEMDWQAIQQVQGWITDIEEVAENALRAASETGAASKEE